MTLYHMLHDGSVWLLIACFTMVVGVVVGLYTEAGSGIASHPYTRASNGGELASDLPPESLGRPAFELLLSGRGTDR